MSYISQFISIKIPWYSWALERVKAILADIWNPQDNLRVFHVAGTNGKGSVSMMLHQVLSGEYGYKVWLFLSPHIIDIRERWMIDGKMIWEERLEIYLEKILPLQYVYGQMWFFEIAVIVAVLYFIDERVDYAIFEVGIGGLLDPTNIFDKPLACFITSISKDHTSLLWTTLQSIQINKMGIMKLGIPIYTRVSNNLMKKTAYEKWAFLRIIKKKIDTNLLGKHQSENAGLVYSCLVDLWFEEKSIKTWLLVVTHFGRITEVEQWIFFDGGHNEWWLRALSSYIQQIHAKGIIIVIALSKWDPSIVYNFIKRIDNLNHVFVTHTKLGHPPLNLPTSLWSYLLTYIPNPVQAFAAAKRLKNKDELLFVCGSLFLLWTLKSEV